MADERTWNVVDDDSIRAPHNERGELTSPILYEADLPLLVKVVDALRAAGARVDSSCGTHIHVGVYADVDRFAALIDLMLREEPGLIEDLEIHPDRTRYAKPLDPNFVARYRRQRPTSLDEFWEQWYGDSNWRQRRTAFDDERRYHGLNFHSYHFHETIEFRYFNGTLDSDEVVSHIQSCLDFVQRSGLLPARAQ